jgi:hypothetical protein
LARAIAAAERRNVLIYIDDHEEEFKRRGDVPGDRYLHAVFRQYQPGWALVTMAIRAAHYCSRGARDRGANACLGVEVD